MNSTNLDDLKLEYQQLTDPEKFIRFAKEFGDGAGINRYKSAQSYWAVPTDTDYDFPNMYEYHFPLFYQTLRELGRIFKLRKFPMWELYATICSATAYKNMPHVMLLWERRKYHGLKDYTLNMHELLGFDVPSQDNESAIVDKLRQEGSGVPDNLRYTIS